MGNSASALIRTTADRAARAYAACAGLDPEGLATPESAAQAGDSFSLFTDTGQLTFTVSADGGVCWVHAAAGTGKGMTAEGLRMIETLAAVAECRAVGFQTVRRGLVRKAQALGYRITGQVGRGFTLEKSIA